MKKLWEGHPCWLCSTFVKKIENTDAEWTLYDVTYKPHRDFTGGRFLELYMDDQHIDDLDYTDDPKVREAWIASRVEEYGRVEE